MTRIKIESNPYEQNISFSKFDFDGESFQPITDSSSKLLSVDFTKCFFPFKAKEILSQLVDEYAVNGNLEIVFDVQVFPLPVVYLQGLYLKHQYY